MSRSSFVPRPEVDAVASLLAQERLVTPTGPGGTGKTRLAVEVGRRSKDAFPDGVVFVGLDGVRQPALVPAAVIDVLGLTSGAASPSQRLKRYLDGRRVLLVLDNFEQVLDAADLVEGTDQRATAELHQARREAQQAGDRRLEAWAVWGLSDIGVTMGDWDLAARSGEEALTMFRELDDPFGIGWSCS